MKKEYEKKIWQIRDDMRKVPLAISGKGAASATVQSYISAYRDLEVEHEKLFCFFDYLQQLVFWEEQIKKADEWDKDEIQGTIDYCREQMESYFNGYHSWVQERCAEYWQ